MKSEESKTLWRVTTSIFFKLKIAPSEICMFISIIMKVLEIQKMVGRCVAFFT